MQNGLLAGKGVENMSLEKRRNIKSRDEQICENYGGDDFV